jgi:hypothetical protein
MSENESSLPVIAALADEVLAKVAPELAKADAWDTADAPNRFFAYVPKGGPPSARKLPLASTQRKDYDPAIIRNAIARFSQTQMPAAYRGKARKKICAVLNSWNHGHTDQKIDSDFCGK